MMKLIGKLGTTRYKWIGKQIRLGLIEAYGEDSLKGKSKKELDKSLFDIIKDQKIERIR